MYDSPQQSLPEGDETVAGYSDSIAELLRQRLSEQVGYMSRLRSVSERERELLHRRDLDRIAEHEVEKQRLIEEIRRRDREIEVLKRNWEREAADQPAETRKQIQSLLNELAEQMRQVVEIEGDNVTIVRRLRDEVETELRRLIGLRRNNGYRDLANPAGGRFVDTEA